MQLRVRQIIRFSSYLAVALLLLLLLPFMLVVFQPSLVQAPLTQAISLITGRQFQIEGAFHLEPSFQPHLTASRVTLANAPWAKVPQLIEIEHIQVSVDLIALFRGSIRLPTLQIAGATINLEQNAAGRKN